MINDQQNRQALAFDDRPPAERARRDGCRIALQIIYQALGQTDSADRLLTAPCSARSLTMWRWMTFGCYAIRISPWATRVFMPSARRRLVSETSGAGRVWKLTRTSAGCRTLSARLAEARQALALPMPNPGAVESAADFMRRVTRVEVLRCSCCAVRVVPSGDSGWCKPCPGWRGCRHPEQSRGPLLAGDRREAQTISNRWSNAMPCRNRQAAVWATLDDGIHYKQLRPSDTANRS